VDLAWQRQISGGIKKNNKNSLCSGSAPEVIVSISN
jgi:hypothetical protein